jgi:hypothetical protein
MRSVGENHEITFAENCRIHPFDNYVIWPGSLALINREPITLRNLLMRAILQGDFQSTTHDK